MAKPLCSSAGSPGLVPGQGTRPQGLQLRRGRATYITNIFLKRRRKRNKSGYSHTHTSVHTCTRTQTHTHYGKGTDIIIQ